LLARLVLQGSFVHFESPFMKESAMSEMIATPRHRPVGNERREHPPFFRPLLLTIGVLGFAIVASAVGLARAARLGAVAESVGEFPTRELPPEWRWAPKSVDYEHMYRQKTSPRYDWIRLSR
jgi:hypothetical protein